MVGTGLLSTVGLVIDDRTLVGAPIWLKPFKFSVSLLLYAVSIAWMLSLSTRARRTGWWAGTVIAVTGTVEMVIIVGQVVRGRRSHFNNETAFDSTLYDVMAFSIVALWVSALVIAVLLFRSRLTDRASAWGLRLGSAIALAGAGLGFLMTLPTSEQLAAQDDGRTLEVVGAHSVGVPDGGASMPLTDWSTTGGDLRVPHFVGMHALQLLPFLLVALAALAPRLPRLRDEAVRLRLVLTAAGAYAAAVGLTTWQALRGQPLLEPDAATLTGAAVIVVGTALATAFSLRSGRPSGERSDDRSGDRAGTTTTDRHGARTDEGASA
ncbi:hypothetical protein JNUCC64_05015 [Streptomyces sp. JNUCC 64]